MASIECGLYNLPNHENEKMENYGRDYIKSAIMGSCSLLDARHYHGILKYEVKPMLFEIMQSIELEKIEHTSYLKVEWINR